MLKVAELSFTKLIGLPLNNDWLYELSTISGQKPVFVIPDNKNDVVVWTKHGVNTQPLQCVANGEEPMVYRWYKNGILLPSANESEFVVANLRPRDNGKYKCEVSNIHGKISHTFDIHVVGKSVMAQSIETTAPAPGEDRGN